MACLVDDEIYPEVQWTTSVSKLLREEFVLQDPSLTKEVTIEDILCHRTGIPAHDVSYFGPDAKSPDDPKSMTRNLRNLPVAKPLRTTWLYSNIMYTVVSYLVETVSGKPYTEFLHEKLWGPLGMSNTFHDIPDVEARGAQDRLATGYVWKEDEGAYNDVPTYAQPMGQGAGGIFSSASDYAKWIRALIKQSPPLSKAAHKELITPRMVMPIQEGGELPFFSDPLYALGLIKESYRGHTVIGHDGDVDGFKAIFRYLPDSDWGIVVFGNSESAYEVEQILVHCLIDEVLHVPIGDRVDWAAYTRDAKDKEDAENDDEEDFKKPEEPEPLAIALENLVGSYYHPGYKHLVLKMQNGKLVADCRDRCFPFVLTFEHLTGQKFTADLCHVWIRSTEKIGSEIRLSGGSVLAVGIAFEEDMDGLTWFDRLS